MSFAVDDFASLATRATTCDGLFHAGVHGVAAIHQTADGRTEFVHFDSGQTLVHIPSGMGYPAWYPLLPAEIQHPLQAVLMDLDGTSVHSEGFWMWIIEQTIAQLLGHPTFEFAEVDHPHVAGHSVSEHLRYALTKYAPEFSVEQAREVYYTITRREMSAILDGSGRVDAFEPAPGLKDFLLELKARRLRIGLVTSGLHEKAWPEIVAAFRQLGMGRPEEFYDVIITAGHALGQGQPGTMGELQLKPHPWLYAEAARIGMGIDFADRHRVLGIEDSGAGVIAVRLAGFACVGVGGGNIEASGTASLCTALRPNLHAILDLLD